MRVVVFGLTVSSAWGNGHATLWRSLIKALIQKGHSVTFYEKDVPYYREQRDLHGLGPGGTMRLYQTFSDIQDEAARSLREADLAICTSYCPDGREACAAILNSNATIKAFYDLDTPVTLALLSAGERVAYLPERGLRDFDVVLSYTGGKALDELQARLGAVNVATLYGWVDPESHFPGEPSDALCNSFSYLGTYAADRQQALQTLFLEPAAQLPEQKFLIGGAQYPHDFPWRANVAFVQHVEPCRHPEFFASSRATLNITRSTMARYGYCPSGRLFEAAACCVPIVSDYFEGLETFFDLRTELLCVSNAQEVIAALSLSDRELRRVAQAARERVLSDHTAARRVDELEAICNRVGTAVHA